jgi:flagellar protein FlbT
MRLKPGERLILNGAVIRNASPRAVALEVLNIVTTLHERDLILPEQADTPLKTLYLHIQMMHLEPENHHLYYDPFVKLSALLYTEYLRAGDDAGCALVSELITLVGERNFPTALRRMQKEIGRPGDARQSKISDNNEK